MDDEPFSLPDLNIAGDLRGALERAQDELIQLVRERESLERRIDQLQSDIVHLAALCRVEVEDPIKQLGLTDAVRYILAREKRGLTFQEIVDALSKSSYDVSDYKNISANVHTVVGRLIRSDEVRAMGQPDTPTRIIWVKKGPPPMPSWYKERLVDKVRKIQAEGEKDKK